MQQPKVPKLPINDPSSSTIRILALDAKYGVMPMHGMQTVAHPNTETMEKDGNPPLTIFVTLKPELEHQGGETTCNELVDDVDSI
jgi:hypothetical protein